MAILWHVVDIFFPTSDMHLILQSVYLQFK